MALAHDGIRYAGAFDISDGQRTRRVRLLLSSRTLASDAVAPADRFGQADLSPAAKARLLTRFRAALTRQQRATEPALRAAAVEGLAVLAGQEPNAGIAPRPDADDAAYRASLSAVGERLQQLAAAVAAKPNDAGARLRLGRLLLQTDRHAQAEIQLEVACRLAPASLDAHYQLAQARHWQDDHRGALAAIAVVIRLAPKVGHYRQCRDDYRDALRRAGG